jgi:hypothetical protein
MTKQTRFTRAKIREMFYQWHGGISSALYAAASSGLVADVASLQGELRDCAKLCEIPRTAPHDEPAKNAAEARYLRALADALPAMLTTSVVVRGIDYKVLPWVSRSYFGEEATKRPAQGLSLALHP